MSEYDDDNDIDEEEPANEDTVAIPKAEYEKLRKRDRIDAKADKAAQAAQKELLFVKQGIDTDSPLGKLLLAGYTGELTAEAIRAEAIAVGALEAEVVPPGPEITPEEAASTDERSQLANGAAVDTITDPDPRGTAIERGRAALEQGAQEAVASGIAFRELASNQDLWEKVG